MIDLGTLSMTEIIRLQSQLQQELTRRFECCKGLAFSDIVASTQYFERFGDAAGRQLQQLHFDLLSQCLPAMQGLIVDTAGDGAFMVFPSADAAARALIDLQNVLSAENAKRARDQQLMVRIGIHFGPVLTEGVVVSGDSVNLCSRVAVSADSGEI
jgi:class 3 adenylate cyclase